MLKSKDKKFLKLPDIEKDFSEWYNSVVFCADLAEHAPTRGCFVIKPYGYSIWEEMQKQLDKKIKNMGVQNASFPMLIPLSFIEKEKDHIEGFAPEIAVVTHAGGKELEEKLVVRPTSETIIHWMFAKWIKSWRDLPLKINQWCNVVRWERRPRAFLRTTEFLWQEGHTAHENNEEAYKQAYQAREAYSKFIYDFLAIPLILGKKPNYEKFAGAAETLTLEAMMPDGKALQMGTSHVLGQSFCESFEIKFQDRDGVLKYPVLTSWGITTRLIGALIMAHGDQKGLILPPKIAPIQIVIVPLFKDENELLILNKVLEIEKILKDLEFKVFVDSSKDERPGSKFNKWELKGVPFRIEIGEKEIDENVFTLTRRDILNKEKVNFFEIKNNAKDFLKKEFDDFNLRIYEKAKLRQEKNTFYDFLSEKEWGPKIQEENGFFVVYWCGKNETVDVFKKYSASVRCILEESEDFSANVCATCIDSSCRPTSKVLLAKSY